MAVGVTHGEGNVIDGVPFSVEAMADETIERRL